MTARFMPPSFCFTAEGEILVARGDRNVQRWDGLLSALKDAGVPVPPTGVAVAGSSTGTITGARFAYQRWLDSRGNVSNLSPVSSVATLGSSKAVSGATNASPIVITATAHGFSDGNTVLIEGCIGNTAANGLWVIGSATTDTFALVGSSGNGVYASGGTAYRGVGQVDYTSVDAPTDARVTKRQILRNKLGDVQTFYVDVESTNLNDTSFSSTNADSALTTAVPLIDAQGNDLSVERYAEPPNWKRFIVQHKARTWLCGQWEYREGSVAVTNSSTSVTGIGTNFTSAMVGWYLVVDGATTSYQVTGISGQTLTIASYGGTTNPYAKYALVPPLLNTEGGAERRTIYFSEAGRPESFHLGYALTLPEDRAAGDITGLVSYNNTLYVMCDRVIKRVAFSVRPQEDAIVSTSLYRGAVNHRVTVEADGVLYVMDRRGIYKFGGNYDEDISKPIRPLFDGTADGYRINWRDTRYFHAAHFEEDHTIKWFCVLGGGKYPKHAICYHYRQQRWWLEEYSLPILSNCVGELGGRQVVFLGTSARRVLAANQGSLDGIAASASGTLRGTVTGSDLLSLTDSSAQFHTTKLVGLPVRIVSGTGAGQERIIVVATATKLTVKTEWTIKPDTTSVYQIGGFGWTYRTGRFRWIPSEQQSARTLQVVFEPTDDASRMAACLYRDSETSPLTFGRDYVSNGVTVVSGEPDIAFDTTGDEGYATQDITSTKGHRVHGRARVSVELSGTPNSERQKVYGLTVEGAVK